MEFVQRDKLNRTYDKRLHEKLLATGRRRFRESVAYEALIQYAVKTLGITEEEARRLY